MKCIQKENGKYKWNADELSKCITCDPETLKFDDDRIERDCIIQARDPRKEPFGNTTGWFGAMCRAVHFKNLGLHRTRTNKTEKISNQLAPSDAWIPGSGDY